MSKTKKTIYKSITKYYKSVCLNVSSHSLIIFVSFFALIGLVLLVKSHAASPTVAVQPEAGNVTAPAVKGNDTSASGGGYIQFKKPSGITNIPSTIDDTGTADVTNSLNTYLAGLTNGATVNFPVNGRYRIEGTLLLDNKTGITLNGNNSTFFATTNGSKVPPPAPCDYHTMGVSFCFPNRIRMHWDFESDTNLIVRDMNVIGSNPTASTTSVYLFDYEAQTAFNIGSGNNILIDHVNAKQTWGDGVYIGGGGVNKAAQNVTIQNSTIDAAGRSCMPITFADQVTVQNNSIGLVKGCRRSMFDLEANATTSIIANLNIHNNDLGMSGFNTIGNIGHAAIEHDITFDGNRMHNHAIQIDSEGQIGGLRRSNFHITNNTGVLLPNQIIIEITFADGIFVSGNTQAFATSWPARSIYGTQAPVWTDCSTNINVSGNNFTPRPAGMPEVSNHNFSC